MSKIYISKETGRPRCQECMKDCMECKEERWVKTPYKMKNSKDSLSVKAVAPYWKCLYCGLEMQSDIQQIEAVLSILKSIEAYVGKDGMDLQDVQQMEELENELHRRKEEMNVKLHSEDADSEKAGAVAEESRTVL